MTEKSGSIFMRKCNEFYKKNSRVIENILFPLILFLWPLLRINQGLSMADTMYALSNYEFFPQITGPWMQATYLANSLGYLFMKLPGGGTVLGMYFYTGLVLSAIFLIVYYMLRKTLGAPITAAGELIACCMCWCPTLLLYNYLTYMLMTLGIIFLWKAMTCTSGEISGESSGKTTGEISGETSEEMPGTAAGAALKGHQKTAVKHAPGMSSRYCIAAGFCLGLNVMSRMANAAEAAFIVALWLSPMFMRRCAGSTAHARSTFARIVRQTLLCIAGWAAGFLIPYAVICAQYGTKAYGDMINNMFSMTDQATDYKFSSMLNGMFGDYGRGIAWIMPMAVCAAAIVLICIFIKKRNAKAADITGKILSVCGVILCVRFCWGRGMFNYNYYEYRSMYYWAVIFLILALICALCKIFDKRENNSIRLLALLVLLEILLTPFGSNNQLYPIINNMFLTVPFTLYSLYGFVCANKMRTSELSVTQAVSASNHQCTWLIPVSYFIYAVILMTTIQSIGFYFGFALQDGVWGDARDTQTTVSKKTSGVYTTQQNAKDIDELCAYAAKNGLAGRSTIIYGDAPGAGYLLDMSPALSSFWPSLPSYSYSDWQRDIAIVESSMDKSSTDKNGTDKNSTDMNSTDKNSTDKNDTDKNSRDNSITEYVDTARPVVVVTSGVAAYIDSCSGMPDTATQDTATQDTATQDTATQDTVMQDVAADNTKTEITETSLGYVDPEYLKDDEKLKDLQRFMKQYSYAKTFSDEQFTVYE